MRMAFSTVLSAALHGLQVELVYVEADVSNGLPLFHMVGYLSSEVKEAAARVRTAMENSKLVFPPKKILVNLAPATLRKKGASFDLPIALALLGTFGVFPASKLDGTLVIGELGLDGKVRKVSGILPIVMRAKEAGCHTCIVPKGNLTEGALVEGIRIVGVENLQAVCRYLENQIKNMKSGIEIVDKSQGIYPVRKFSGNPLNLDSVDYSEIRGQHAVKRAAEIAVAGGHNLLLIGPPGSGKSMIARRIPTILPPPSIEESMEMTKIYSVLGLLDEDKPLITGRPFRDVHHTITKSALIGGGGVPTPGEISLSHGGVLFLDELAEFQKPVLEVLRQPLEE